MIHPQFENGVHTVNVPRAHQALIRVVRVAGVMGGVVCASQSLSSKSLCKLRNGGHIAGIKFVHFLPFYPWISVPHLFSPFSSAKGKDVLFLGEAPCSPYFLSSSDGSVLLFLVSLVFLPAPSHLLVNR